MISCPFFRQTTVFCLHPDYLSLEPFLRALPSLFAEGEGELIHDGRNKLRLLTYQSTNYVVKQFRQPNFINQWVYGTFRKPKSQRAFENAIRLIQIGVGTPQPVGYINYRRGPLFADSYLVTLKSECPWRYDMLFHRHFDCQEKVLRAVGRLTACLHEHGIAHLDYGRGNILFAQRAGDIHLELVDLNRMHFGPVGMIDGCKNLRRLPATPQMHRWIAEEYARVRGFDAGECYELMRHYREGEPGQEAGEFPVN